MRENCWRDQQIIFSWSCDLDNTPDAWAQSPLHPLGPQHPCSAQTSTSTLMELYFDSQPRLQSDDVGYMLLLGNTNKITSAKMISGFHYKKPLCPIYMQTSKLASNFTYTQPENRYGSAGNMHEQRVQRRLLVSHIASFQEIMKAKPVKRHQFKMARKKKTRIVLPIRIFHATNLLIVFFVEKGRKHLSGWR